MQLMEPEVIHGVDPQLVAMHEAGYCPFPLPEQGASRGDRAAARAPPDQGSTASSRPGRRQHGVIRAILTQPEQEFKAMSTGA